MSKAGKRILQGAKEATALAMDKADLSQYGTHNFPQKESSDNATMSHPDDYAGLMDWQLYGPRDPEVALLVNQLAYGKGMRLAEIEDIIKAALREQLSRPDQSTE